jgi:hypothetical protein
MVFPVWFLEKEGEGGVMSGGRKRDADGFEVPKKTFSHRYEHDDNDSDSVTVVGATNDDAVFQGE